MNLAQLAIGDTARVVTLSVSVELAQRLSALGLRRDSVVTVLRRGWLGGPLQLRIGGTEIMLRRSAAQDIDIVALASEPVAAALNSLNNAKVMP